MTRRFRQQDRGSRPRTRHWRKVPAARHWDASRRAAGQSVSALCPAHWLGEARQRLARDGLQVQHYLPHVALSTGSDMAPGCPGWDDQFGGAAARAL